MNDNTHTLPFPADSAEYEEYIEVMNNLSDIAHNSAPDPMPSDLKSGICEDAPCCGCCGQQDDSYPYGEYDPYEDYNYRDDIPDDSCEEEYTNMDTDEQHEYEDQYLDSMYEDACEYGMEGCCGDF